MFFRIGGREQRQAEERHALLRYAPRPMRHPIG